MNSRGIGATLLLVYVMMEQAVARSQGTLTTARTTVTRETIANATEAASRVDGCSQVTDHRHGDEKPLTHANITTKRETKHKQKKEGRAGQASELNSKEGGKSGISLGGSLFTSGTSLGTSLLNSGTSLGGTFFDSGLTIDENKFTNPDGTQASSASLGTIPTFDNVSVSINFQEIFLSLLPIALAVIIAAELLAGGGVIAGIVGGIIAIVKGKKKHEDTTGFSSSGYDSSSYGDSSSGSSDMYSSADSSYTAYRALEKAILKYQ